MLVHEYPIAFFIHHSLCLMQDLLNPMFDQQVLKPRNFAGLVQFHTAHPKIDSLLQIADITQAQIWRLSGAHS